MSDNDKNNIKNPANMMSIRSANLVDFSIGVLFADVRYQDPQNDSTGPLHLLENPATVAQFGFIHKSEDNTWAIGAGAFVPAGIGSFSTQQTTFAGEQDYRTLASLIKIVVGGAWQVNDRLSIGAHLGIAIHHAELEGPFFFQTGVIAGAPVLGDLNANGLAPAWAIGFNYRLTDATTIGIAYTGETRFRMNGDAEATIFGLAPVPLTSRFDLEVDFVYPRSLGIGVSHQFDEQHRVFADLVWYNWSQAMDKIDFKYSNASHPALAGGVIQDSFALNWRDTLSIKLGYEYRPVEDHTFRLGYVYHRSPVPNSTLTIYIPATLEHTITTGYSLHCGDWSFNVAYLFSFGRKRTVGDSLIVGGDFDNSAIQTQYHTVYLGITRSF